MSKRITKEQINLRFNMTTLIVYMLAAILIIQLFNLQIINGASYREQSNTRLTRESVLEATRGEIVDRTGTVLATSKMGFNIELYKTKIDNNTLNNTLLKLTTLLEENGQTYPNNFPIDINPFKFKIEGETLSKWKSKYKIDESATAEEAFYKFKEKYKIENNDINEIRKIIAIRYEITTKGYSNTKSISIAKDVSSDIVAKLSEQNEQFPGITIVTEPVRNYVSGSLASHILGYVGPINEDEYKEKKDIYANDDVIGRTGVEYVFEEYLKGKNGTKQIDMSVDGTSVGEYTTEEAISGSDIVLTIDANLQKIAEDALEANIKKIASGGFSHSYDAKAGSVAVMNVKTGEILALANYPDYEPQEFIGGISTEKYNEYQEQKALYNRVISGAYSPGSIFKMVSAIAGLESGAISATERINDTGIYSYGNNTWKCWYYTDYHRGHGYVNVSGAIQHSCNYYFYETARRMGIDNLVKYAKYFGLGSKTGIELPSETAGTLASKETSAALNKTWNGGDVLNAVIGQGDNHFSPLQMVKYISMVANGGNKIEPTIIKSVRNEDGTEENKEKINEFVNQKLGYTEEENDDITINQENLKVVLEGMRSVTEEAGGTAYNIFKNFNIPVGGKTGSAEAGKDANGNSIVHAWFAGFAPFDNPEIAVVVMVENGGHGNYTAEVVRDIISEYFGMNIDNVEENMTAVPYTEILR